MLRCEKLLESTSRQYDRIEKAAKAFRNCEISGEEFSRVSWNALEEIDKIIKEYESK